ncbi:MAG: hypothetical protein JO016_11955 [Actinobacteria bacterium]|nr:hypothetical protein [Actinomycetota bacterium]
MGSEGVTTGEPVGGVGESAPVALGLGARQALAANGPVSAVIVSAVAVSAVAGSATDGSAADGSAADGPAASDPATAGSATMG